MFRYTECELPIANWFSHCHQNYINPLTAALTCRQSGGLLPHGRGCAHASRLTTRERPPPSFGGAGGPRGAAQSPERFQEESVKRKLHTWNID